MNRVRRIEADDLPALFAEFAARFRFNPLIIRPDYFDWQFFDDAAERYAAFAAWEDRRPVGFVGYQPFTLMTGDRAAPAGYSMLWFSQKRDGTGLALFKAVQQETAAQVMVSNSLMSQRIFSAMGMRCIPRFPRRLGFLNKEKARLLIRGDGEIDDLIARSVGKLTEIAAQPALPLIDRYEDNRNYLRADDDIFVFARRTGADLNRRYRDIPAHDYKMAGGERGAAVWRIEPVAGHDFSVLRILEWTFGPQDEDASAAMAAMVGSGLSAGAALMDFHCAAPAVCDRLHRFGMMSDEDLSGCFVPWLFRPTSYDPDLLVVNAAVNAPPGALCSAGLYLTRGDGDLDRRKL